MKESSKERLATLLMDELLERLSARESLRKMFGEMTSLPIDEVIEHLIADVEHSVQEYHQKYLSSAKPAVTKQSGQPVGEVVNDIENAGAPQKSSSQTKDVLSLVARSTREDRSATDAVPSSAISTSSRSTTTEIQGTEQTSSGPSIAEPTKSEPQRVESKQVKTPRDVSPDAKPEPAKQKSVQFDPIRLEFPKIRLKADIPVAGNPGGSVEQPAPVLPAEVKKEPAVSEISAKQQEDLRRLQELALKIESRYTANARREQGPTEAPTQKEEPRVELPAVPVHPPVSTSMPIEDDEEIDTVGVGVSGKRTTRASYAFADDEYVYVHAVGRSPSDEGSLPETFMLEEKGIDGHGFAFAFDYNGMRFYLSKVNPNEMNVSKAMVLLLNKQESLQLQGVHESTLNDLRGHGMLLPFEFGTVARGKDSLLTLIDKNIEDLEEALDDVENTTWWTVTASVLDATIARIVGTDVQSIGRDRSRDRASYTSAPQGKKFDIKVLERILQREKKLAESVHAELSAAATRADVDTMIGLGSGSSEDWKVILKASYDVPKRDIAKFCRAVTDLQYHHLQYDLMLALTGNRDFFTLSRK